jgi:potassium-transporting ATPase KdpC subunit
MNVHLRANLLLLVLTVLLCSVAYPLVLWGIGQTVFHEKAQGSLVTDASGKPVGSMLIAQPFTADEYFQPRPSSVSYNAAASGASNWSASNYLLRDRVARQLGPIVKYRSGPNKGQLVGLDVEAWFQKDQFDGKSGIVAQWASMHSASGIPQNWVKADKLNTEYVEQWRKSHPDEVAQWVTAHPETPEPKPEDLAELFFASYSRTYPGTFPSAIERKTADGKTEKTIEPIKEGADIQAMFFDMWLQSHPDVDLEHVPADAVMASGSGLDPDITLANALWQLDRVAAAWAKNTNSGEARLHKEIEQLLHEKSHAPLGGLAGVPLINVLEMNIALKERCQKVTSVPSP